MREKWKRLISRWMCLVFVCVVFVSVVRVQDVLAEDDEYVAENPSPADSEEYDGDEDANGLRFFNGKINLELLAEAILSYTDIADEGDATSGELWDAYIASLGIGVNIRMTSWLSGDLLVEVEDLGKYNESATTSMSEAYATLRVPWVPIYFIGGKRTQPFGVFQDRMISGTLTEELYEIVEPGVTLGFDPGIYGLNLSLTVYRGPAVMDNLVKFKTHEYEPARDSSRGLDNYILNLEAAPLGDNLKLAIFYNSESGRELRNESAGVAVSYTFFNCVVDGEYITALSRERGTDQAHNLESAWTLGVAYQLLETLQLAVRYEIFDDDRSGKQDEVVAHRYLGGLNFAVTEYAILSFEYRHTTLEREIGSQTAGEINEYQLQLAFEF